MISTKLSEDFDETHGKVPSESMHAAREVAAVNSFRRMKASRRASRIASGEKQTKLLPMRRNALPVHVTNVAKARHYWTILRLAVLERRLHMDSNIFVKDDEIDSEITTLKQGFHLKQCIKYDQSLLFVDHHFASFHRIVDPAGTKDDGQSGGKAKNLYLVAFDRLHRLVTWELKQADKACFKDAIKGGGDIAHFIYITKFNVYAFCYLDEIVRFYNSNMEYVNDIQIPHDVQFIRYNEKLNILILVGLYKISAWSISMIHSRDSGSISVGTKMEVVYLNEFTSPFGKESWIKAVVLNEKTNQFSLAISSHLIVYDYVEGKIIEKILNATDRPITCIQYHYFYGYTLLGTTSGQGNF